MLSKLLGLRIFDLEASGCCNVRCRYCPRDLLPEKGLMSQETFARFLDGVELGPADTVSFVGLGEPTLNPRLPDFVGRVKARSPRTRTWVTTNGTNLNPRTLPPLLAAGLDTLDISFNGLDPAAYESNMRGASFEATLANIEYARREAARAGGRTRLQINYIVTSENAGQEAAIQAFWRARGLEEFRSNRMHTRAGTVRVEDMTPADAAPVRTQRGCAVFDLFDFVSWRGQVLYCCNDIRRAHVIGDVHAEPWARIAARKREIARQRRWPAMCASCLDVNVEAMVRRALVAQAVGGVRASLRRLRRLAPVGAEERQ